MKAIVTDWQMRGPETINDHADAAYDAAVLDRLDELHRRRRGVARAARRVAPAARPLRRAARPPRPRRRRNGNGKYVASPRVDSYHSAWFELHEDLIRLAGRTRESETAAGRA